MLNFLWAAMILLSPILGKSRSGIPLKRVRPRVSFRPTLEVLEGRYAPATYTWVFNGPGAGNWNDARNWTGGPANTFPHTGQDVAVFTSDGQGNAVLQQSIALNGLVMGQDYLGTLTLNNTLTTVDGDALIGGSIAQPNGVNSTLFINGSDRWEGTVLNSGPNLSYINIGQTGSLDADKGASTIGDTINIINGGTLYFDHNLGQNVNFTNNAGINNGPGGLVDFLGGARQGVDTAGTGVLNNLGQVQKSNFWTSLGTTCGLPLINNSDGASLVLYGPLEFTRAGSQTNVSVQQNYGTTKLYATTLTADFGFVMNNGTLQTYGMYGQTIASSAINVDLNNAGANVQIHGGTITIDVDNAFDGNRRYFGLFTNGAVTMDGGNWIESFNYDAANNVFQSDYISAAKGITLGGTAQLTIETSNWPVGGVKAGVSYAIMDGGSGKVTGNFATVTEDPAGLFTTGTDPTGEYYVLTTTGK